MHTVQEAFGHQRYAGKELYRKRSRHFFCRLAGAGEEHMKQNMWALIAHERGGPEQLAYEQAPRPYVGVGDALVRVCAASFTPTELT